MEEVAGKIIRFSWDSRVRIWDPLGTSTPTPASLRYIFLHSLYFPTFSYISLYFLRIRRHPFPRRTIPLARTTKKQITQVVRCEMQPCTHTHTHTRAPAVRSKTRQRITLHEGMSFLGRYIAIGVHLGMSFSVWNVDWLTDW